MTIKEKNELLNKRSVIKNKNRVSTNFKAFYSYLDNLNAKTVPLISIVLPLYNEEKTITKVLENLPHHDLIEIIVVDDDSKDNSLEEIKKAHFSRNIKIIRHDHNQGYGQAILSGIKNSLGKVIVTMDSDGQHSSDDIFNLIKPVIEEEADFTIGSRYLGKYFYKLPIYTRLGEIVVEKILQIFFRIKIENNQNGFRAFNRDITHFFDKVNYQGYAFCTETILLAKLNGYKIKECPIKLYDREFGYSKIIVPQIAIRIFMCIFQYIGIKLFRLQTRKDNSFYQKVFKKLSNYP